MRSDHQIAGDAKILQLVVLVNGPPLGKPFEITRPSRCLLDFAQSLSDVEVIAASSIASLTLTALLCLRCPVFSPPLARDLVSNRFMRRTALALLMPVYTMIHVIKLVCGYFSYLFIAFLCKKHGFL